MPMTTPTSSSAADPLAQLRDIHLPDPVSAIPALGWWLLAALLLGALIALATWLYRRWQRNAYRRTASELLQHIRTSGNSGLQQAQALNQLLKRTALTVYPTLAIRTLSGREWSQFLEQTLSTPPTGSDCFGDLLYQPDAQSQYPLEQAYQFAEYWLAHHHRQLPTHPQGGDHA